MHFGNLTDLIYILSIPSRAFSKRMGLPSSLALVCEGFPLVAKVNFGMKTFVYVVHMFGMCDKRREAGNVTINQGIRKSIFFYR